MNNEGGATTGIIKTVTTCGGTMNVGGKSMEFYSCAMTGVKEGDEYEYTTVTQKTKGGDEPSHIITKKIPKT